KFDATIPLVGIARIEARGQMDFLPDGATRIQSARWTAQNAFKATINVNGECGASGISSLNIDIADGRVGLNGSAHSRVGGWLILNRSGDAPWSLSGQVMAGLAKLHGIAFNSLTVSAEGTAQDAKLTVQGSG